MKTILCSLGVVVLLVGCSSVRQAELSDGSYYMDVFMRDGSSTRQDLRVPGCGVLDTSATGPSGSRWMIESNLGCDELFITHASPGTVPEDAWQLNLYTSTTVKLCYRGTNLYLRLEDNIGNRRAWYRIEIRQDDIVLIEPDEIHQDW